MTAFLHQMTGLVKAALHPPPSAPPPPPAVEVDDFDDLHQEDLDVLDLDNQQEDSQVHLAAKAFVASTFSDLARIFPDKFESVRRPGNLPPGVVWPHNAVDKSVKLKVNPFITGGWLDPKGLSEPADKVRFWPDRTRFPSAQVVFPARCPF